MGTFIKLDRKMLSNKYLLYPRKAQQLRVWLYLLMNAAYEVKSDETLRKYGYDHLEPGQLIRSRETICHDLRLTDSQVKTSLRNLQKDNMITCKSTNKNTLITIVNWAVYQSGKKQNDQQNDQQNDSKMTDKKTAKSPQTKNIYPTDILKENTKNNEPSPAGAGSAIVRKVEGGGDMPDGWTQKLEDLFAETYEKNSETYPGFCRQILYDVGGWDEEE